MSICNCKDIAHSSWDYTSPATELVDDTTIDDLSAKKVITVHTEIIKSKDKSKACSLRGLLEDLKDASWVKSDSDNINRVKELIKQLCDKVIKTKCTCEEKLDDTNACKDDKVIKAKEDCESPKVWSDCKCVKGEEKKKKKKPILGCLDKNALNYAGPGNTNGNNDGTAMVPPADTKAVGNCRYNVALAPISHNISFYKIGEFPLGKKATMVKDRSSYSVCVLEREYKKLGDDKVFQGYQDDSLPSLYNIEGDRFKFKGDVGFYGAEDKETLISDVNRAITWYMGRVAATTKDNPWDDCTPQIASINNIIVEIKGEGGVNHGVIRFEQGKPTLRIDVPSLAMWLNYRAANTTEGVGKLPNDIKFRHTKVKGTFFDMTCAHYIKDNNYTSKSKYKCIGDDGEWITISKGVSESKIGLGTLLGRKDKPITGLGGLLED